MNDDLDPIVRRAFERTYLAAPAPRPRSPRPKRDHREGALAAAGLAIVLVLAVAIVGRALSARGQNVAAPPEATVGSVAPSNGSEALAPIPECKATLNAPISDSVVLVLADGERIGTAMIVGLNTNQVLGRVELGYGPVVALDARNRQVVAVCSTQDNSTTSLVAFRLDDLSVRWRVPFAERILTTGGGWPSVLASVDGRYLFTYHYRTLRPGDANAPGATRYWIGVRDARTGALMREVETPQCGVALFHQATPDLLFISCPLSGELRAIRTDTWQEDRKFPVPSGRLAGLTDAGDRYVSVTGDLWTYTTDTATGRQLTASHWSDTATPVVPFFGRLAMSSDGSELWVPTAPPGHDVTPGNAIADIDLARGDRRVQPVPALGAVGLAEHRVLYVQDGWLRSIDGTVQLNLGVAYRVVTWRIGP